MTVTKNRFLAATTAVMLALPGLIPGTGSVAAEETGWPRTVTDVNGYSVTLDGPSQRSAPLPPPLGTFAVAISGGTERIVAVHPWSKSVMQDEVLQEYFPAVADIPTGAIGAGFMPNVEELLRSDPDLVFQVGFVGDDVVAPITAVGLPVLTIDVGSRDDARDWIPMLGQIYGEEHRAQAILDWRDSVQEEIALTLANLDPEDHPTVAHLTAYGQQLRVVGSGHFRNWQIRLTGGVNVAEELDTGAQAISPEQLLVWNPDVILLTAFQPDLVPEQLYQDPRLQDLAAVQQRRVYSFPVGGDRWEAPVAESPLGWMWLSELLHPERFDWPLQTKISAAHQLLYNHQPRPESFARMLRMKENVGSRNYDRYLDH